MQRTELFHNNELQQTLTGDYAQLLGKAMSIRFETTSIHSTIYDCR